MLRGSWSESYETLLERTVPMRLPSGLAVRVLDLPSLIRLKEQAGRPKDLAALPALRTTLDEIQRRRS